MEYTNIVLERPEAGIALLRLNRPKQLNALSRALMSELAHAFDTLARLIYRKSATSETFLRWWASYQKQSADAIEEFTTKHGVKLLAPPPEISLAFLKTWDEFAAAELPGLGLPPNGRGETHLVHARS